MGRTSKRDFILDSAERLFEAQGYVATGVNQIINEADVVTMTLYNNFPTKDALVVAVLNRRSDSFLDGARRQIGKAGADPALRIQAVFDVVDRWVGAELKKPAGFSGCLFLSAAAEFKNPDHPVHEAAVEHKLAISELFRVELKKLEPKGATERARAVQLLLDGGITQAQLLQDASSVKRAGGLAKRIILADMQLSNENLK